MCSVCRRHWHMHALQTGLKCRMARVAGESGTFVWPSSRKVAAAKQVRAAGFSGYSLQWRIPFSQRTRSRVVRVWLHAISCALARARVSAFYNGGSCTRAMKKRDIRTLTSVTKQGRRNRSGQSRTTLQRSRNQYS